MYECIYLCDILHAYIHTLEVPVDDGGEDSLQSGIIELCKAKQIEMAQEARSDPVPTPAYIQIDIVVYVSMYIWTTKIEDMYTYLQDPSQR